jgi:LemA protein
LEAIASPSEFSRITSSVKLVASSGDRFRLAAGNGRTASRKLFRIIEGLITMLLAFLMLITVSFLMLRPTLKEIRIEARAEWAALARTIPERNNLLPGLVESFKGFESGYGRMTDRLTQARSISMRSTDPDRIIAATDEIDRTLEDIKKIAESKSVLAQYPPFATQWKKVEKVSLRISRHRAQYNNTATSYNRLLGVFPQNLLAAAFGFVPLNIYNSVGGMVATAR